MKTTAAERAEFRTGIRSFLEQYSPETEVRRLMTDRLGYDPDVWRRLSTEIGLPGVLVPEANGGQGLSFVELAVAVEEAGRALACAPVLSSAGVATAALLLARESEHRGQLLAGLATGDLIATVAEGSREPSVTALGSNENDLALTGSVPRVLDAQIADVALVRAQYDGRLALFAVRMDADGLDVSDLAVLDLTHKQSALELRSVSGRLLDADYARGSARLGDIAAILASAEILGASAKALEIAVEYALTREQFGSLIGSFQAIKHLLADDLARVEQMRAAVAAGAEAASSVSEDRPESDDLSEIASVVKTYCSQASVLVAQDLIQVLGGIGYTWEHPAHLYLRRVRSLGMLYGSASEHRRRLAAGFGLLASRIGA